MLHNSIGQHKATIKVYKVLNIYNIMLVELKFKQEKRISEI